MDEGAELQRSEDSTKAAVGTARRRVQAQAQSVPHLPNVLTCPWDDDNETATGGQLADDRQVLAEGLGVGDEVGGHG